MTTRSIKFIGLIALAAVGFTLGYLAKDLFLDLLLGGSMF